MKKIIYIFFVFSFAMIACEKDEPNNNNDSVLTKANVSGSVFLYDEYGKSVANYRMKVYMQSTSASFSAETDKDGSFLVTNVSYFNNYKITYEKDGFGTHKKFGFEHEYTGYEGNISSVNLSEKSSAYCSSIQTTLSNDTSHFHLQLSGGSDSGKRKIRLLFHTIPEISNDIFSHYTVKFTANNAEAIISLSKEYLLNEVGLISGQTYYVQAYGDSYYSNSYFDEDLQKRVLPNLGLNEELAVPTSSFIMP